jgi:hypothetical protein
MKRPVVTITNFCLNHAGYFDWLVTGLGILAEKGAIELRFRLPAAKNLLRHRYLRWAAKAVAKNWVAQANGKMWWLEAEIDFGGQVRTFVFDVTDYSAAYAEPLLETVDLYFKCQFPKSFPAPLALNQTIQRPMASAAIAHAHKVRPAMLGRPLSRSLNLRKNLQFLRQWESHFTAEKSTRLFAYFGSDTDPEQATAMKEDAGKYQHPNAKRARLVKFLRELNHPGVDARLVTSVDRSLLGPALNDDAAYAAAVAKSAYNLNISGLGMSIPFRLIDSFMMGTAIVTDSLAMRWYEPFDPEHEVIELGPMGYELESQVDWSQIEKKLHSLLAQPAKEDATRAQHLQERYRSHWSPEALASYVIREMKQLV